LKFYLPVVFTFSRYETCEGYTVIWTPGNRKDPYGKVGQIGVKCLVVSYLPLDTLLCSYVYL